MRLLTLFTVMASLAWAQPQPNPGNTGGGSGVGGATTIGIGLAKSGTDLVTDSAIIPQKNTANIYAAGSMQSFTSSATLPPFRLLGVPYSDRTLGNFGFDTVSKRHTFTDGSSLFFGMANPGTIAGDTIICLDTKTPCTEGVVAAGATNTVYGGNGTGVAPSFRIPQFSWLGGVAVSSQLGSGVNKQTGTTYTYADSDRATLVTHTNGSAIAGTLPQANGSTFTGTWFVEVQNRGAGTLTITPTTSTIDGNAALALTTGQGARIFSDGTNYFTQRGIGGGGMTIPGSGTELMYRSNATTLNALANSSVPNAGEFLLTTTPNASATRCNWCFGGTLVHGSASGNYFGGHSSGFAGKVLHFEDDAGSGNYGVFSVHGLNVTPTLTLSPHSNNSLYSVITTGSGVSGSGGGLQLEVLDNGLNGDVCFKNTSASNCRAQLDLRQGAATIGQFIKYKDLATAGVGLVPIYGAVHSTAQTAAITTATLCAAAVCTGGMYKISAVVLSTVTCATPGPGVVAVNLTWTDEAGTKTTQTLPLDDNNALTLSSSLALGATTGYAFGTMLIRSTGANPIQYATTYTACTTGTGTYNIDLTVEQKQ